MKKEFDYYIYIDYSENLIGYMIIEKNKIRELIPKIIKLNHYSGLRHKSAYIHSIKRVLEKNNIIKEKKQNLEIYSDVLHFLKQHDNCLILVSIDNHEYANFKKLVNIIDGEKTKILRECELKKGSPEYRMSLILDTILNIERLKIIWGK